MPPDHPVERRAAPAVRLALTAAVSLLLAAWLWRCLCLFPGQGWNEVRVAPAVQMWHGSPYAGLHSGPTTTWIYGPLPLLLMSPVLLAGTAIGAMLLGAWLNLFTVVVPIVATAVYWPAPGLARSGWLRTWVALAALAFWPGATYRYFTADNVAVAGGLVSLLLLARSRAPATSFPAAAACAAALLCKQTLVGLAVAQLIWLAWTESRTAAVRYAIRVAVITLAGYAVAVWAWGFDSLTFSILDLPARQPWTSDWIERVRIFWPDLLLQLVLPGAVLLGGWRRIFAHSLWRLLALVWIVSVPLDLAAFFRDGGGANSLHAGLLVAPGALVAGGALVTRRRLLTATVTLSAAMLGTQLQLIAPTVWAPQIEHLRQADAIARSRPGEVYFPWHPLVSYYTEGRIYEVEDGLFIRAKAGLPVPRNDARLPPRMHQIAFLRHEQHWGIAGRLAAPGAPITMVGMWDLLACPASHADR